MKTMNRFTIRLANGNEQTFASAAAMVQWMDQQRGLEYRAKPRRSKSPRSKPADRQVSTPDKPEKDRGQAPLARYARRQLGSTQQSL